MTVEILISGKLARDALVHQGLHVVDHEFALSVIVKARGQTVEEAQGTFRKSGDRKSRTKRHGAARESRLDTLWHGSKRG